MEKLQFKEELRPCGRSEQTENNHIYYASYQKIYQLSQQLAEHLQQQSHRTHKIQQIIKELTERSQEFKDHIRPSQPERKRKSRRAADQIEKQFICDLCLGQKRYASNASLRIHIKLKHPEHYIPQRKSRSSSEQDYSMSE